MREERKGELYIFGGALIWAFFPIVTVLSYKSVPSMISLAVSTFIASIFFLSVVIYKKRLNELLNPLLWKYMFYIVLFLGILVYGLYYYGLTKTTPGNASIIGLTELCFSYIFFHLIRKEPFSYESKVGAFLMLIGALVVLIPNFSSFNSGDFFILLANMFAPLGNLFQQKAKKIASAESILFLRTIVSTPFLLIMAYMFGQYLKFQEIKISFFFLIINGLIILGLSKIFWVEGISRIPVTKANALSSVIPLITLFFSWLIFSQVPTIWQIISLIPFFLGVLLLTNNLKLKQNAKSN